MSGKDVPPARRPQVAISNTEMVQHMQTTCTALYQHGFPEAPCLRPCAEYFGGINRGKISDVKKGLHHLVNFDPTKSGPTQLEVVLKAHRDANTIAEAPVPTTTNTSSTPEAMIVMRATTMNIEKAKRTKEETFVAKITWAEPTVRLTTTRLYISLSTSHVPRPIQPTRSNLLRP